MLLRKLILISPFFQEERLPLLPLLSLPHPLSPYPPPPSLFAHDQSRCRLTCTTLIRAAAAAAEEWWWRESLLQRRCCCCKTSDSHQKLPAPPRLSPLLLLSETNPVTLDPFSTTPPLLQKRGEGREEEGGGEEVKCVTRRRHRAARRVGQHWAGGEGARDGAAISCRLSSRCQT